MIERARLMHERARIDLIRLRDALLADLACHRRASRAASGYAGTPPGRSDARRPQRLDVVRRNYT